MNKIIFLQPRAQIKTAEEIIQGTNPKDCILIAFSKERRRFTKQDKRKEWGGYLEICGVESLEIFDAFAPAYSTILKEWESWEVESKKIVQNIVHQQGLNPHSSYLFWGKDFIDTYKANIFYSLCSIVYHDGTLVEASKPICKGENFEGIVYKSQKMDEVVQTIKRYKNLESPILILGETGTGKELVAQAIHKQSGCKGNFEAVNCASISSTLCYSDLWGHTSGAFTGAMYDKKGHFEIASEGTLFLNEINSLPMEIQGNLLRVLQTKKFRKLGEEIDRDTNAKVVAASNEDLEKLVAQGQFRKDLYFRLNGFSIWIPPLRERKEDILPLSFWGKIQLECPLEEKTRAYSIQQEEDFFRMLSISLYQENKQGKICLLKSAKCDKLGIFIINNKKMKKRIKQALQDSSLRCILSLRLI